MIKIIPILSLNDNCFSKMDVLVCVDITRTSVFFKLILDFIYKVTHPQMPLLQCSQIPFLKYIFVCIRMEIP